MDALILAETRKQLISNATSAEEKKTLRDMTDAQLREFLEHNTNLLDR